jgi:hypothetical protein
MISGYTLAGFRRPNIRRGNEDSFTEFQKEIWET